MWIKNTGVCPVDDTYRLRLRYCDDLNGYDYPNLKPSDIFWSNIAENGDFSIAEYEVIGE